MNLQGRDTQTKPRNMRAMRALDSRIRASGQLRAASSPWWLALAAVFIFGGLAVRAETIIVTGNDSTVDGADGVCSLPEAINAANDDMASGTVWGECAAGSGADTIYLFVVGPVTLTDVKTEYPLGVGIGLPSVTTNITIEGDGQTIQRSPSAPPFRIVYLYYTGDLTLKNLTLAGGEVPGDEEGGAIYASGGRLKLINATLTGNSAGTGGAVHGASNLEIEGSTFSNNVAATRGAAIWSAVSRVEITDSTFSNNVVVSGSGGAIYSIASEMTVTRTGFVSNQATYGGGICFEVNNTGQGRLVLRESAMTGNTASSVGGGIFNWGGTVEVIDSTLTGNIAQYGGGIQNENGPGGTAVSALEVVRSTLAENRAAAGGGIYSASGSAWFVNSTLSGNIAQGGAGGGVYVKESEVSLAHSTVMGSVAFSGGAGVHNERGTVTASDSIVADSTGPNCGGVIDDDGKNFDDDESCPFLGTVSVGGGDPDIEATLSFNGGPTQTHALLPGSAAINAQTCSLALDQRRGLRDGGCDSGAYEFYADDPYEFSGVSGSDDQCRGHRIPFGLMESHLHRDVDWAWFSPAYGATYEIETSDLTGSLPDTWLELWRDCSDPLGPLETDDDGGEGKASRITYPAVLADLAPGLKIAVHQLGGFYGPDKSYNLEVRCVAGCPDCDAPGSYVFPFYDEKIFFSRTIEACERIEVGRTEIMSGGKLILRAGEEVRLGEGFSVDANGELVIDIDASLVP